MYVRSCQVVGGGSLGRWDRGLGSIISHLGARASVVVQYGTVLYGMVALSHDARKVLGRPLGIVLYVQYYYVLHYIT